MHITKILPIAGIAGLMSCLQQRSIDVEWTVPVAANRPAMITVAGKVETRRPFVVSGAKGGIIMVSDLTEGQPVKQGDTLAIIDNNAELRAVQLAREELVAEQALLEKLTTYDKILAEQQVIQAQLVENSIQKQVSSTEFQVQQGSETPVELDNKKERFAKAISDRIMAEAALGVLVSSELTLQKSKIHQAEIRLRMAQDALSKSYICSPVDGIIERITTFRGELYSTTLPLVVITPKNNSHTVVCMVPVYNRHNLYSGQQIRLRLEHDAYWRCTAFVKYIAPPKDSFSNTISVYCTDVSNKDLLSAQQGIVANFQFDSLEQLLQLPKRYIRQASLSTGVVFGKKGNTAFSISIPYYFIDSDSCLIPQRVITGNDTLIAGPGLFDGATISLR